MKKRHLTLLVAMAVCIAGLMGYKAYDRAVTDNRPPQIIMEDGELQVSVYDSRDVLLQGVTAKDDTDGDVTASLIVESVGSITDDDRVTVTYAAFDQAGNVAKKTRTVHYTDYVSPRFYLEEPLAFGYGSGKDIVDLIGAYDKVDGDITHRVKVTSLESEPISAPGVYKVLIQVHNSLGDIQNLTLEVKIYPSGSYNSQLNLKNYLVYLPVGEGFDAEDYLDSFVWAGNTTKLSGGVPGELDLVLSGQVDVTKPGVYTVEYTMSRSYGSQSYTGFAELVVVVEE